VTPDLSDLDRSMRGRVLLPDRPGYDAAKLIWNSRFDRVRPVAIAEVADARDVQTAVNFARDHGLRPIPRSGAHSFAGYSTGDGLVVDTHRLTAVDVDSGAGHARCGGGSTLLATYEALWSHRVAVVAGTCPTVGVTGLTCGGGLGVLSRQNGATCDGLVEVEMVTADGKPLRANEHENDDLYWATRGGGGGNFGVITALTFQTVPVDTPFTHAHYAFPWKAAEQVLDAWQHWLPTSPRATWSVVEILTQPPEEGSSPIVEIEVVQAGGAGATRRAVADLLGAIGTAPVESSVHAGPFVDTQYDFYCKGLRPKECTLAGKTPAGKVSRAAMYAKSDIARGPWPADGLKTLLDGMQRRQRDRLLTPRNSSPTDTVGKVIIEAADGAVNSTPADATAFVHRDNLFLVQYQARWQQGAHGDVADANVEWTNDLYARTTPYRSGFAYQDYIDPELEGWERAYYGENLDRLQRIKAKYDPKDLFRFAQSIPLPGATDA